ncbi:MAG: BON domain-containing protein [Porticoccaceae bacterium]
MLLTFLRTRAAIARLLVVGLLGSAASLTSYSVNAAEERVGAKIDDAAITAEVKTRVLADEVSRSININVDTAQGHVTLRGTAPTEAAKSRAEEIAEGVKGVKTVANALILGDASVNPQTATAKAKGATNASANVAGDTWITTKVKAQLLADDMVKGLDIDVSTQAGVTALSGVVPTEAVRERAIAIATKVEGVKSVDARNLKPAS